VLLVLVLVVVLVVGRLALRREFGAHLRYIFGQFRLLPAGRDPPFCFRYRIIRRRLVIILLRRVAIAIAIAIANGTVTLVRPGRGRAAVVVTNRRPPVMVME